MTPRFKIVPLSRIVPVMRFNEEKTMHLKDLMESSGVINSPLQLFSIPRGRWLLIQETSILEAARRLGLEAIPAQIISPADSPQVFLEILVKDSFISDIIAAAERFPRDVSIIKNKKDLRTNRGNCVLALPGSEGTVQFLSFRRASHGCLTAALYDLLDLLDNRRALSPVMYFNPQKTANIKQFGIWRRIRLRDIKIEDLIAVAGRGRLFPAGALQFETGPRLMGIDYPLAVLQEKASLREKDHFLRDLLSLRLCSGYPEFLGGSVYLVYNTVKK